MQHKKRALIYIILSSLFAGIGQLFFKSSTVDTQSYFEIFITPWFYLGIVSYGVATILMIISFKNGELSILFPILSTTYIWTIIITINIFIDEDINFLRILGIFFIILGAGSLGMQQKKNTIQSQKLNNKINHIAGK